MRIAIRDWQASDVTLIATLWLAAYAQVALPDAPLRRDAPRVMKDWLRDRFRDRKALGFVAEVDGDFAGFLLARVGEWDSDPPILERRHIGLIDVVYVVEAHRRRGVATRLVRYLIERAELRGARGLETTFEVFSHPAVALWKSLGFVPWVQRAYRPVGEPE